MATKSTKPAKAVKPKIKVEEIAEEKPAEAENINKSEPVKISSFSQLDTEGKSSMPATAQTSQESVLKPPETLSTNENSEPPSNVDDPNEKMSSEDVREWLRDIRPDTTKEVEKGGGFDFKLFFGFLVLFALIGALIGGLYYYKERVSGLIPVGQNPEVTPTSEAATPMPTAEPTPGVDLSKLKVSVLNGSGISGEAGKVESLLVKAGFENSLITTGNASAFNHTSTSVSLKKALPAEVFDKIKAALGDGYDVEKAAGDLREASPNDIEITVGKKG